MEDECLIVSALEKKSPPGGQPVKKLKQSRLPFALVNNKSPKEEETISIEKKRKLSGSNGSSNDTKTPRYEKKQKIKIADENVQVEELSAEETDLKSCNSGSLTSAISSKANVEIRDKEIKNKGENKAVPANILKDSAEKNQLNNEDSPAVKLGRSPLTKKLTPCNGDPNKSVDLNKSIVSNHEEEHESGNSLQETKVEDEDEYVDCRVAVNSDTGKDDSVTDDQKERDEVNKYTGNEKLESKINCKAPHKSKVLDERDEVPNEDKSNEDQTLDLSNDDEREEISEKNGVSDEGVANEEVKKKRGRPKGSFKRSLTPEEENIPKRKRGRPPGSKNTPKDNKHGNLDNSSPTTKNKDRSFSISGNHVASKNKTPMEKTRSLLALFAAKPHCRDATTSPCDKLVTKSKFNKANVADSSSARQSCGKKSLNSEDPEDRTSSPSKNSKIIESSGKEDSEVTKSSSSKELEKGNKNYEEGDCEYENDNGGDENSELAEERILFSLDDQEQMKVKKDGINNMNQNESSNKTDENVEKKKDDQDVTREAKSESSPSMDKLDESSEMDVSNSSACGSEANTSQTMTPGNSSDTNNSILGPVSGTPTSAGPKTNLFVQPKKLTPKQKEKEAAKQLKMEERAKRKEEKEKQLQEKMAEKERLRKQKEEEKKLRDEEKQKQKEEREKAKEEMKKKKQEEQDAKKLKKEEEQQRKEEERLKKEEEKQKKEEEQQQKEEEKRKQSDILKKKFASFFVAKKRDTDDDVKESGGPFQEFQVKEDMHLAPVVRLKLTDNQCAVLDEYIQGKQEDPQKTYLHVLKSGEYFVSTSNRTFPLEKKKVEDDNDIEIIDDEDEEDIGDVIQVPETMFGKSQTHKAKLLSFCENQRPAYWGTWSKKSASVSARRPFAKDDVFDYDYDSDDDWEEEETGESLSDSEGDDKKEKSTDCDLR